MDAAARNLGAGAARSLGAFGVASAVFLISGCYGFIQKPVTDVAPDDVIEVSINDAGRVALASRAGPEITRLQGKVVSRSDTAINLMVSHVMYINGALNRWQGQELTLRNQDVTQVSERTFSRRRTLVLAVVIGAVAAIALTQTGLSGVFGGSGKENRPDPPPES